MIYSMTAFARATFDAHGCQLIWELKSVNHRYLETSFRVPDALRVIEHPLRELARKHLKRGKLDCTLKVEKVGGQGGISINREVLLQLLAAIEQVRRDAPEISSISPIDLLRWPGVLDDTPTEDQAIVRSAKDLFEQALTDLIESRRREGAALFNTIASRLDDIDALTGQLKPLAAELPRQQKQKLQQKLNELTVSVDSDRLEQEVALLAQKADVAEELDRLTIHVEEARSHINGHGPHGRRLDFLTQELNREANTLGAKSVVPETSQRAVDLKVLIEQIREQVQNIE
ncbi:MAG: YicC/YloC family endoribonuclease [Pseudomonadota bacterium]